jgi:hypothetical protein
MSLARLFAGQGKRGDAHQALAAGYGEFTPSMCSGARALLEEVV